jgi:hypothetical protein
VVRRGQTRSALFTSSKSFPTVSLRRIWKDHLQL